VSAYGTWMLARREVARYMNVWGQTVVPPVISAVLYLAVFGQALGSRIGGFQGIPYITFIVPGLLLQGAIVNAYNNTASSLFDARRARYVQDVLTSPLSDVQIVLAYVASGTSRGLLIGLATLAIALPFGGGWHVDPALFALVLLGTCVGFALLGLVVGLHATRFDHIFAPITFLLTPLTFLGGMFYPVSALPPRLAAASRYNPILYLVDAQRAATLGVHDLDLAASVAALVLADGLLFVAVVVLFGRSRRLRG
jgi:ABC-2 type transport system permease protein